MSKRKRIRGRTGIALGVLVGIVVDVIARLVADTFLGTLPNYLYDLLKRVGLFSARPGLIDLLVVGLVTALVVPLLIALDLIQRRSENGHLAQPTPFMADPPPKDFVERPQEYGELVGHLLKGRHGRPVAITAALRGAGGYGKTVLARAICHDRRVRRAFRDGILWATLSESPNVLGELRKVYAELTGEHPPFVDSREAARKLEQEVGGRTCLIVVDDVWNEAHLRPFLGFGPRCAYLITTRNRDVLPSEAVQVNVDAMRGNEPVELLQKGLPKADRARLEALALRLGAWPLLLTLASSAIQAKIEDGLPAEDALTEVDEELDAFGLTAFDAGDAEERDQAVAATVRVSLRQLEPGDRERYQQLCIFPEDSDIPLATLATLWGTSPIEARRLCQRLYRRSLLLGYDVTQQTVRLHDVMRTYLLSALSRDRLADALPALHRRFLDAYALHRWADLPPDEPYLWHHLATHLREAGRGDELRSLLLDFCYIRAKLASTDVNALLADYEAASVEEDAALTSAQGAIRLAAHVLADDPAQLPGQLHGRLSPEHGPAVQALLQQATRRTVRAWLRPLVASLTPPGGALLRTLEGHTAGVSAVALSPDGRAAVSASRDRTLKVWDPQTGQCTRTLEGHTASVMAVALSPDGRAAISASDDQTLKVWDLQTGQIIASFHAEGALYACAVAPDGRTIVAGGASGRVHFLRLEEPGTDRREGSE